MAAGTTLIIGGTRGLGLDLARRLAERGENVVLTGRDADVAASVAAEIGPSASSAAVDLTRPAEIASALESMERVDHIVLMAIDRDANSVRDYRIEQALQLATLKLVGYTEVLHCLHPRMHEDTSVLLFGGQAKDRPYPGSTTVTSVNGAVVSMVRTWRSSLRPCASMPCTPGSWATAQPGRTTPRCSMPSWPELLRGDW
jgi:NADP-dependent 3-hydroxy acid dehydrogenase YdfG